MAIISARAKRRTGQALLIVGLVLFVLSVIGPFQRPDEDFGEHAPWDRFDADLYKATPTYARLVDYARNEVAQMSSDEQKALAVQDIVTRRFVHGEARETMLTNFPKYLGGLISPPIGSIYSSDRLLRSGNMGLCSQQTHVLVDLAQDVGLKARQVGLHGHVVAEIWIDGKWRMFDPDFELVLRRPDGQIASVANLEKRWNGLTRAYGERGHPEVPAMYRSREDNSYVSYPSGAYVEWKSSVMLNAGSMLRISRWLIALLLCALGLFLIRRYPKLGPKRAARLRIFKTA